MSYNLFLDDCRTPTMNYGELPWVIVRNYDEFCSVLKEQGSPDYVSLDHDLSRQAAYLYYEMKREHETEIDYTRLTDRTGYDCLIKLIIAYEQSYNPDVTENKIPLNINIHSHNRFGVKAMKALINNRLDDNSYSLTTKEHPYKLEGHLMPLRDDFKNNE